MRPERAIGGVMPAQADTPPVADSLWRAWGAEGRDHAAFANARSALAALIADRAPARVWLPAYACPALAEATAAAGVETRFHAIDATLEPDAARLSRELGANDAVVVVDYFGRPPGQAWRSLAADFPDLLWIEDRAQALETAAPPFGSVRLFSPRKLIGVGDGGILVGQAPLPAARDAAPMAWGPETARALDPDGHAPQAWYGLFRRREARQVVGRQAASDRSLAALAATAAPPVAESRRANWRVLARALGSYALWPLASPAFAPLAFPILVEDAAGTVERLAARGIWAPRHWSDPPSPAAEFPEAHWLAAHCVSLPLDQRYDADDMGRLAEAVLAVAAPAGAR
jgi:dTDP-4-amino-4,6-dideoxygalactose transaminase